ncbi:MAG: T9SS type A sorting domain-containing protein [Dysgonamonadaceae bacterium]|jgi:hypothetical protein|nr:T9SS type A sorting domain-containing protein [Dysgonamonadaceae bacterium]
MKKFYFLLLSVIFGINAMFANMPPAESSFYVKLNSNWASAGTIVLRAYNDTRLTMTAVPGETNLYETTITAAFVGGSGFELLRTNPDGGATWDKIYGLNDLTWNPNNCFTINDGVWGGSSGVAASSNGTASVYTPQTTTEPSVTLTVPAQVFIDETITLDASALNVTDPVITYSVKVPGSNLFIAASSPYQPEIVGTYTFKAEVAASGNPAVLAFDVKDVIVKAIPAPITIRVKIPADWSTVSFYYWTIGEGQFATPTLNNNYYSYTFNREESINLIFVNGSDWASEPGEGATEQDWKDFKGTQTVNIENVTESTCYEIIDATYDDGDPDWGKRHVTINADCDFTNIPAIAHNDKVIVENHVIRASFEGSAKVELYTISGQLIRSVTANNEFSQNVQQGVYLLRIHGVTHKVMVR